MKITEKKKDKKEKKIKIKPKKEHVLIVAQEIKFARLLSGNEKTTRDRALKTLKKWILNCFQKGYGFKESDFLRIWKGLFFAVWMSDKPLVQEELCESIAGILDLFPPEQLKHGLLLVKAGFQTIAAEWYGIDQHRMDKCLMLVRRYLRGSLRMLLRCGWSVHSCRMYADVLAGRDGILSVKTPHYARNATSMIMHVIDCFLEELSKVSEGKIPEDSMAELLKPFCAYICSGEAPTLIVAARRLLTELIRQSELGLEYEEKTRAWKQMGCPAGGPDALEPDSEDDEDNVGNEDDEDMEHSSPRPLDPRAGRVNVVLDPLPVPVSQLVTMLSTMIRATGSKARKRAKLCLQRFQQLGSNKYPLKVSEVDIEPALPRGSRTKAAVALHTLDRTAAQEADELALRGLSRKHRKRLLAKSRAGLSIVEDVARIKSSNGDWKVEPEKKTENNENSHNHENNENRKRKLDKKQDGGAKRRKLEKDLKKEPRLKLKDPSKKLDKIKKSIKNAERIKSELGKKNKVVNGVGKDLVKSKSNLTKKEKSNKELGNNDKGRSKFSKGNDNLSDSKKAKDFLEKSKKADKKSDLTVKSNKSTNSPKILDKSSKTANLPKILDSKMAEKTKKVTKNTDLTKKPDKITDSLYLKHSKIETRSTDVRSKALRTSNANKAKNFQKILSPRSEGNSSKIKNINNASKRVKFVLKNNSIQGPVDYYKSVKRSPNIPFDSSKVPTKTNLKVSAPSPINPFFKKKLKMK